MKERFKGVVPPIVTPFDANEEIDLAALAHNFERWNKSGVVGYLILGSNGEGVYLSEAEQEKMLAASREHIPADKLMIAGSGAESTKVTIQKTNRAAELGADAALIVTPNYYKGQMKPDLLVDHYRRVADESKIPILVYNVPANTGVNMPAPAIASLADHPNLIGVKDSSGDVAQVSELVRIAPDDFIVMQGASKCFYQGLTVGACGGMLAMANALPKSCVAIYNAFAAGDHAEAARLNQAITPFGLMATAQYGVGLLKVAMDLIGFKGGQARSPLKRITDPAVLKTLDQALAPFKEMED